MGIRGHKALGHFRPRAPQWARRPPRLSCRPEMGRSAGRSDNGLMTSSSSSTKADSIKRERQVPARAAVHAPAEELLELVESRRQLRASADPT